MWTQSGIYATGIPKAGAHLPAPGGPAPTVSAAFGALSGAGVAAAVGGEGEGTRRGGDAAGRRLNPSLARRREKDYPLVKFGGT